MITVGTLNEKTREAWIQKTLKKIPKGSHILDAGAGEQQFKKFCRYLKYVSQDFGKYTGEGDKKGLQVGAWDNSKLDIISDIKSIPVKDKSFDAILCTEVLEHLPDPILALREFSRIIKKNGFLIITAPFCSLTHFSPYHFSTGFNKYYYQEHLENFGFEIIEIEPNGNYFEFLAQEIRRISVVKKMYIKNSKRNYFETIVRKLMLLFLQNLSKKDNGSSELLCFGYNVFARKIK